MQFGFPSFGSYPCAQGGPFPDYLNASSNPFATPNPFG
jgi:hypothetical protein